MKLVHIITGLNKGGAEASLYKLLTELQRDGFDNVVISITDEGFYGKKIKELGIEVYCLRFDQGFYLSLKGIIRCRQIIKNFSADVIQAWMYHANLLAVVLKPFLPRVKIVFNVRQSLIKGYDKFLTLIVIYLNAMLSRFANRVVNNSIFSQKQHEAIGFSKKNSIHIGNGFDIELFHINKKKYDSFREMHHLTHDCKIVGNIARFHPIKNHFGLLKIFHNLKVQYDGDIFFVLAGKDVDYNNKKLIEQINMLSLQDSCILLGSVNTPDIMPVLDLYVSSSLGEGFPCIIGEALACGIPCIATDVGDCKKIIGENGGVAHPSDISTLVDLCVRWLNHPIRKKEEIRQYLFENYSMKKNAKQYKELYFSL